MPRHDNEGQLLAWQAAQAVKRSGEIVGWFRWETPLTILGAYPVFDPMIHSTPARQPKPITHQWVEDFIGNG